MQTPAFSVRHAAWKEDSALIKAVRTAVFVEEQRIDAALDFDGLDGACRHVIAVDERGQAIGTGRVQADGHIGRLAVLKPWRGKGVGTGLLQLLEQAVAQAGLGQVYLNAQISAMAFYRRQGYRPVGGIFIEAGIPHQKMIKALDVAK